MTEATIYTTDSDDVVFTREEENVAVDREKSLIYILYADEAVKEIINMRNECFQSIKLKNTCGDDK